MRWVLALVVVSMLLAPAAYAADLTYMGATIDYGAGSFAPSTTTVRLYSSNLVFNPSAASNQITDTTTINSSRGASSLTINGGAFNTVETIAGINAAGQSYGPVTGQDEIIYGPSNMTVALTHVNGYDTALVMTNTYSNRGSGYGGGAVIFSGTDIGTAGNGTHFVYLNGTAGINTATTGGMAAHMFTLSAGVPEFVTFAAASSFGTNAVEVMPLSTSGRVTSLSAPASTQNVLLTGGNQTSEAGTVASLKLENVAQLNMNINTLNILSGSMIVTGTSTTINGGGHINSTNVTTAGNPGDVALVIYNTADLTWDTVCASDMTLLGTGTITLKQAPTGRVSWQAGSLVWDNDNASPVQLGTGAAGDRQHVESHAADGGALVKNGTGEVRILTSVNDNGLSGISGITVNGGILTLAEDDQPNGGSGSYNPATVRAGNHIFVNSGTLQIGLALDAGRGLNLDASTVVELQGGTMTLMNKQSQIHAIDVPYGQTGSIAVPSGPGYSGPGDRMPIIPTLTGSGTLRIASDCSALITQYSTTPDSGGNGFTWTTLGIAYGGHTNDAHSVDTNASAFTGNIDIATGAVLAADDQTAWGNANDAQALWPVNAKSLVVEAGGWFLVGDWDTWGNLSITGQNVRGNGNICMNTSGFGVLVSGPTHPESNHGGTLTINSAQVSPGLQSGVGKLTVYGNTAFTGSSTLNIRVTGSGAVAGTDYDQLVSKNFYGGQTSTVSGLANATLHVTIPTGLSLKNDVLTIVLSAAGGGTAGTIQDFTGSAFGKVVFDSFAVADVNYNNGSITLSRLATAGDVTRNGYVDGGDLNVLLSNWNAGTAGGLTYAMHDVGDVSHNGKIDGGDLNILLSNWNAGVPGQGIDGAAGVVPEPMTLTLLGLGAMGLLRSRRRS